MLTKPIIWTIFVQCFFRDSGRMLEWLNILFLPLFAWHMISVPDLFTRPAYSAFQGGPRLWAAIMVAIAVAQLIAMWPVFRFGWFVRFIAMAGAAGFWAVLSAVFSQGSQPTVVTLLFGAIAFLTGITGVYFGLAGKQH